MILHFKYFLLLIMLFSIQACNDKPNVFDSYSVAFETPSGNKIWGRVIRFDDRWSVPLGSMACCWGDAGASSSVFNKPMPKKIYVEWLDESEKRIYKSTIILSEEISRKAKDLPSIRWDIDGKTSKKLFLIVGFKEQGMVNVWLSNAVSNKNKTGRVKHLIAEAQAIGEPWTKK